MGSEMCIRDSTYKETIIEGLERAPEALQRMLAGDTLGKTLVQVQADG